MPQYQNDTNPIKDPSVLITGGSGLIGRYLTSLLLAEGYNVSHLSRKTNQFGKVRVYRWDPEKNIIDPAIFDGVNHIIHLAGANIGDKRWSSNRKEEIIGSRVNSTWFLHKTISENNIKLKSFISASAIGYYGSISSENIFRESDSAGKDFLGNTCRLWEEAADMFENTGIRTVKIRTGVVLEKSDSALSKLMKATKFGFVVQTGDGTQYMPWIHINDLCKIYLKAIEDRSMSGAYNAVAPGHVTHKEFIRTLANTVKRPVFPVSIPAFALRIALGEMSDVILKGSRVSSGKITNAGYEFLFPELEAALKETLSCK